MHGPSPDDVAAVPAGTAARTVALCLSGGGLRATLFHFGLLKAMATHRQNGVTALALVDSIYAVSGGSIAAAHLLRHWTRYADPAELPGLQDEMIAFAGRNIRDRVVRRWLLAGWLGLSRGRWLEREYRALLGAGTIADCYRAAGAARPPALHILATSFTSGELCGFGPEWFEVEPAGKDERKRRTPGGHLPLAFAVAASSAFPPLFPPVALTPRMLRGPEDPWFQDTLLLSDGGVFDNLGFEKFRAARRAGAAGIDTLIVSNAGSSFRTGGDDTYSGIVSRNVRASDILMRRVGDSVERDAGTLTDLHCMDVRIRDTAPDEAVSPATQQLLRLVRTDLDSFGRDLAGMLIDHGYRIGSARLAERGWAPAEAPSAPAASGSDTALSEVAAAAADTTLSSFLFGWRDWRTVPLLWLGIVLLLLVAVSPFAVGYAVWRAQENDKSVAMRHEKDARAHERQIAETARRQADAIYRVRRALASNDAATAIRILDNKLEQAEQTADTAEAAAAAPVTPAAGPPSTPTALPSPIPASATVPPQTTHPQAVFIQFAGSYTRDQITRLNAGLRSAGWLAQGPSGERTTAAINTNQVRYSGANRAAAQALADAINAARVEGKPITAAPVKPTPLSKIGANVLELWIFH